MALLQPSASSFTSMRGDAEEHREQGHREQLAAGKGSNDALGDDIEEELAQVGWSLGVSSNSRRIELADVHVHAASRRDDVHDREPDEESNRGQDLEIDQLDHSRRCEANGSARRATNELPRVALVSV